MKIKFFVEVSFSDIHGDTHATSVCSGSQSQCEAHGSLRTVAKQFSVKATFHLTISMRDQRAAGKIQRNNYPSL